jgi:predicted esterase
MKHFSAIILVFLAAITASAQRVRIDITPSGEYMFAQRATCQLFMSVYDPAPESDTRFEGKAKPTILFIFGGGFISGDRNSRGYLPWFRKYNDNGYKVITIDYRLGLKGAGNVGVKDIDVIYNAIQIGVEDLYSATAFIIDNAEALGVDPSNIVIAGSSAGAIISLQAEWHLCNRSGHSGMLPKDFRYAGVMSFSGAIFSREGKIRYAQEPAPTLLMHGTADKIVNYKHIVFFKNRFEGSKPLADIYAKNAYNYNIYRYEGNQHEIASSFVRSFPEQLRFLETNVIKGEKRIVDATVNDPSIKVWGINSTKDLYRNN